MLAKKSSCTDFNMEKLHAGVHMTDKDKKRFKLKKVMSEYKYGSNDSRKGTGFKSNQSKNYQFFHG